MANLMETYNKCKMERFKRLNDPAIRGALVRIFGYRPTKIAVDAFAEMLFHYKGDLRVNTNS